MPVEMWVKAIMAGAVFMIWKELWKANHRDRDDD